MNRRTLLIPILLALVTLPVFAQDAAPAETPPATTTAEATPTEATPTEAAPTEAAPTEATPTEAAPTEAAPTEAAPTEATPTAPPADTPAPTAEAPVTPLPRIAIFPFRSRPNIDTRVPAAMAIKLTADLESTGRFELLERTAMENVRNELELSRKGDIKVKSAASWGQAHGVNYVITGMIVAAGKGQGGMGIGGVRISPKAIALGVDIRLIDCTSETPLIEDTFKEEKDGLSLAMGTVEFDPESRRGSEMVAIVLRLIKRAVLTSIYPPQVIALDESAQRVTLDYGVNVFEVGERWELIAADRSDKLGAIIVESIGDGESTGLITDGVAAVGALATFDKPAKKEKN